MQLRGLLTLLRESYLNDRTDRVSGSSDYLWTDETLVTYINEAHRRFASRSFTLRDGTTPEVTEVTLVEGQGEYTLHESVIGVLSAKVVGQQHDLIRSGHYIFAGQRMDTEGPWDANALAVATPGLPRAYSTDEQMVEGDTCSVDSVSLRVYPVPDADAAGQVIKLRVVRKPLCELTVSSMSQSPEIPIDYHIPMLDWAAYLALRIVDDDAGNLKSASEFRASFEASVKEARLMVLRKMFAPTPIAFGRNGWAWQGGNCP